MLKVLVDYPSRTEERIILDRMTGADLPAVQPVVSEDHLLNARALVNDIYVDDKIKEYVLDLVTATRQPAAAGLPDVAPLLAFGASPRAGIYLIKAARAHAFLNGRGFVTPEDIKELAEDVLRHRLIVTYEAEAEEVTSAQLVARILEHVAIP